MGEAMPSVPPQILSVTYSSQGQPFPAMGGVPAESLVTIGGIGFQTGASVVADAITLFPQLVQTAAGAMSISCILPSVRAMQTDPSYPRNALSVPLTIKVINPDGGASNAVTFPVLLPTPDSGSPGTLQVLPDSLSVTVPAGDHFGAPGEGTGPGGEVRLYASDPVVDRAGLTNAIQTALTTVTPNSGSVALPQPLASTLEAARTTGTLLFPTSWHDDTITARMPDSQDGVLVIWREDLPSQPISVTGLPLTCDQIRDVLSNRWRLDKFALLDGDSFVPSLGETWAMFEALDVAWSQIPLPSGIDPAAAQQFIDGLPVSFRFTISGIAQDRVSGNQQSSLAFLSFFRFMPQLACAERPLPAPDTITVSLDVVVAAGVTACGQLDVPVAQLTLRLPALPIPTVAVAFTDINFGPPLMVMTPKNTPIPGLAGGHFDNDDDNSSPTQVVGAVAGTLQTLVFALNALSSVFPTLAPAGPALSLLSTISDHIASATDPVLLGTGTIDDLSDAVNDDSWFPPSDTNMNNDISSLLVVGAPHFGSLVFFDDDGFDGNTLTVGMPDNAAIAALPDFRNLQAAQFGVPLPYDGGAASGNFNDAPQSMRFQSPSGATDGSL